MITKIFCLPVLTGRIKCVKIIIICNTPKIDFYKQPGKNYSLVSSLNTSSSRLSTFCIDKTLRLFFTAKLKI